MEIIREGFYCPNCVKICRINICGACGSILTEPVTVRYPGFSSFFDNIGIKFFELTEEEVKALNQFFRDQRYISYEFHPLIHELMKKIDLYLKERNQC